MIRKLLVLAGLILVIVAVSFIAPRQAQFAEPAFAAPTQIAWLQNEPPKETKKKGTGKKKQKDKAVETIPGAAPAAAQTQDNGIILSNGDSYDDFVSITQASNGTMYAAYAAYYDNHDQIRLH